METQGILKQYKKKPIFSFDHGNTVNVNYGRNEIYNILPNRDPFLFIDKISAINLSEEWIVGRSFINPDDPIFKGHFPGNPVYPGVLLLEMISEIFCSLYYFLSGNSTSIGSRGMVHLRATRMYDAVLQHGIFPGDEVLITAKQIENTGLTFTGVGQIVKGREVCAVTIGEYYIID